MKDGKELQPGGAADLRLTVGCRCTLEGAPPALRKAITDRLTIDNPRYLDARRFGRWIGKDLKPKLHFFEEEGRPLSFPGLCQPGGSPLP
ncbi:hypothetical protein ACLG6S_07970 [Thermodesulfobacteriota bacterium B35]